eukprot:gene12101-biopygen2180
MPRRPRAGARRGRRPPSHDHVHSRPCVVLLVDRRIPCPGPSQANPLPFGAGGGTLPPAPPEKPLRQRLGTRVSRDSQSCSRGGVVAKISEVALRAQQRERCSAVLRKRRKGVSHHRHASALALPIRGYLRHNVPAVQSYISISVSVAAAAVRRIEPPDPLPGAQPAAVPPPPSV